MTYDQATTAIFAAANVFFPVVPYQLPPQYIQIPVPKPHRDPDFQYQAKTNSRSGHLEGFPYARDPGLHSR